MTNVKRKIHIGDVIVRKDNATNPYGPGQILGEERKSALRHFAKGDNVASYYQFWLAPCAGGARLLTGPDEIDWETSGIERN